MKIPVTLCLIVVLMSLVLAQKDRELINQILFMVILIILFPLAICTSEPKVEGNCDERIRGYSYIANRNRCRRYHFRACSVTGNFFHSRDGCKSKCMDNSEPEGESGFMSFINRTMSQFQSLLSSFMNFASWSWVYNYENKDLKNKVSLYNIIFQVQDAKSISDFN